MIQSATFSIDEIRPRSAALDRVVALTQSTAFLAQGILLLAWSSLTWFIDLQIVIGLLVIALLIHALWKHRHLFPHRLDMNLVMFSFGGLGMLTGSWIDNGFTVPMHLCHAHHMHSFGMLLKSLMTWHIGLMILFPLPYTVLFTRCALIAKTGTLQFFNTYILGTIGMITGMMVFGWLAMQLPVPHAYHLFVSHSSMLLGMIVGMSLFTSVIDWVWGYRQEIQ